MKNGVFDGILLKSMLVWMSVAASLGSVGFIINGMISDLGISAPSLKGLLASSSLIGMLIGAFISGVIGDRIGRWKAAVIFSFLHGISGVVALIFVNYWWFVSWRIVTGIGLGGVLPTIASLVSEYSLPSNRGKRVSLLESSWAYGWLIPVIIAYLLLGVTGWYIYGLLTALIALFLVFPVILLDESPRYLLSTGKVEEARTLAEKYGLRLPENIVPRTSFLRGLRDLFSKDYYLVTLGLWIIWFTITMGYYGLFIWYPRLLSSYGSKIGFQAIAEYLKSKRIEYLLITTLAQIPGYYSAAFLVDRLGRRKVLGSYLVLTSISAYGLAYARTVEEFLAAGIALSFFDLGAWAALYTYTPEQYPTRIRVLGTGWASTIGRLGGIIGPYIVPYLGGWVAVLTFFAVIHVLGATGVLAGRELAGREMVE